jgi:transcriptional regulator with XRE-family HTH domain
MTKDDLDPLRLLIGRLAVAIGPGTRALEDAMGVGHGHVHQLISGRRLLRASHLIGLASFLEIHPAELFEAAYPEGRGARLKLAHWLGAPTPSAAAEGITPDLEERMRIIAREEIAAARKRRGG